MAGYIEGKGIEVVIDPETGLPIPATAEIVACGFSPPPHEDSRQEGPFGEWQGYCASGTRNEPVVYIKTLYHRNDPILFGQTPVKPPVNTWFPIPIHTATFLWNQLEKAGMMDIRGVYVHGPGYLLWSSGPKFDYQPWIAGASRTGTPGPTRRSSVPLGGILMTGFPCSSWTPTSTMSSLKGLWMNF